MAYIAPLCGALVCVCVCVCVCMCVCVLLLLLLLYRNEKNVIFIFISSYQEIFKPRHFHYLIEEMRAILIINHIRTD